MSAEAFRQEMPPPGGYEKFSYSRNPAKTLFKGWMVLAGYIGMSAVSYYLYYQNLKRITFNKLEQKGASLAIYPLLLAEKDREYLKQLRKNRDEERELMKNVEGWKVGTFYGEPIYHLSKEDDPLFRPMFSEYYVHASFNDLKRRGLLSLWT